MALPETVESVTPTVRKAAIASLQQLLGDRLSTTAKIRGLHGKDASYHSCVPPDGVAFAQSTEEVSEIVKICAQHKVPLIPFGSGAGGKIDFLISEHGDAMSVMRVIKKAIDPDNIMNPGKILRV
jgi:FAD/FMN-containing dehydrogenase